MEQPARSLCAAAEANCTTFARPCLCTLQCDACDLALDVFKQMRAEGVRPNVVTYNTLVDVYGKTGQWERAVCVLDEMQLEVGWASGGACTSIGKSFDMLIFWGSEWLRLLCSALVCRSSHMQPMLLAHPLQGLEPEVRTFNTAIIACNMCGQPSEALKVYERLLAAGHMPIATTYTALISAYGKAGQVDRALEAFNTMVAARCERSVITYFSLIRYVPWLAWGALALWWGIRGGSHGLAWWLHAWRLSTRRRAAHPPACLSPSLIPA